MGIRHGTEVVQAKHSIAKIKMSLDHVNLMNGNICKVFVYKSGDRLKDFGRASAHIMNIVFYS